MEDATPAVVYVVGDSNAAGYPRKDVFEKEGADPFPIHLSKLAEVEIRTYARSRNTYSARGGLPTDPPSLAHTPPFPRPPRVPPARYPLISTISSKGR